MSEWAFLLLGYALEHGLASAAIALVVFALCRIQAISAAAKAGVLFVALMLSVLGPALPGSDALIAHHRLLPPAEAAPAPVNRDVPDRIDADAVNPTWLPDHFRIGETAAWLLVAVWGLGTLWQLAKQALGYRTLRRIVAASERSRALERYYRALVRSDVEIRLSASFGPAVVGAWQPKILIPMRWAASLPETAMHAVILHEASHVRRNDVAAHALQKLVEALFWWNPAIRWMAAGLDVSREIACDVEASRSCETPVDYADALLTAIEYAAPSPGARLASALGVADALRTLDRRIDGILQARASAGAPAQLAVAAAMLCMAAACAAAEALSRPLAPMPRPRQAAFADIDASAQAAFEPNAGAAERGDASIGPAAVERIAREEAFRRNASQAEDDFRSAASQAEREFRNSASQADQTYATDTETADARYRKSFEELERLAPAAGFQARFARIVRERSRSASAASRSYESQMQRANGKYATRMAEAKTRFDSALRAGRVH